MPFATHLLSCFIPVFFSFSDNFGQQNLKVCCTANLLHVHSCLGAKNKAFTQHFILQSLESFFARASLHRQIFHDILHSDFRASHILHNPLEHNSQLRERGTLAASSRQGQLAYRSPDVMKYRGKKSFGNNFTLPLTVGIHKLSLTIL